MYKSLQAGRAIAALLVVLLHIGMDISLDKYFGLKEFAVPFAFGNAGVEFFFVLSGFIIFYAHRQDLSHPAKVKHYLFKRITRIYPTFIIIFIGVSLLALLHPVTRAVIPTDFWVILKSLLLIPQDPEIVGGTGAPVIGVAWTLHYEMLFYMAFAFAIINRWFGIAFLAFFVVMYFSRHLLEPEILPFWWDFISKDYLWLFIMGMFIAKLTTSQRLHLKTGIIIASIGLALFIFIAQDVVFETHCFKSYATLLYGVACSMIVYGLVAAEKNGRVFLGHSFVQLLGNASYALYLTHYSLISFLLKIAMMLKLDEWGYIGATITFIAMLVICIAVAIAFHLWIELPVARFLRSKWGSNQHSRGNSIATKT